MKKFLLLVIAAMTLTNCTKEVEIVDSKVKHPIVGEWETFGTERNYADGEYIYSEFAQNERERITFTESGKWISDGEAGKYEIDGNFLFIEEWYDDGFYAYKFEIKGSTLRLIDNGSNYNWILILKKIN